MMKNNNNIRSITLWFCLTLVFSFDVWALEPLAIVTENFPPYNYQNEQGELTGITAILIYKVLDEINYHPQIQVLPWKLAFEQAKSKKNVLIFSILKKKQREPYFIWLATGIPLHMHIYGLEQVEQHEIPLNQLKSFVNKRIGVLAEGSFIPFVHKYINLTKNKLVTDLSYSKLFNKIQQQQLDFIIAPDLLIRYFHLKNKANNKPLKKIIEIPESYQDQIFIAFNKNTDPIWVQLFQHALRKLKFNGELTKIINQFYQQQEGEKP